MNTCKEEDWDKYKAANSKLKNAYDTEAPPPGEGTVRISHPTIRQIG